MADENYQYNVPQQENHENTYYQNVDMQPAPPQEEKANIGLAILSYLIPIVGLVHCTDNFRLPFCKPPLLF